MKPTILWNGREVPFAPGETAAQALARAGIRHFGTSATGQPYAVLCGIGQCQNCLVDVAGKGAQEACLLPCSAGLALTSIQGAGHEQ